MVSPISSAGAPAAAQTLLNTTTSSVSDTSFVHQLETALEQYLGSAGNGSPLEIEIQPASSQGSGARQFLVTVTTPATPAAAIATAPAATVGAAAQATPAPAPAPTTSPKPAAVTAAADTDTSNDPVQVNIGGGGTAMVPSLAWEIANQNKNMSSPLMTPDAILNEDQGELLDSRAQQNVPGTNLKWDDLTQDQQLAYSYYANYGFPTGLDVQRFLDANIGPRIMANAPANNPYLFGNA